jgi:hypothetical protein
LVKRSSAARRYQRNPFQVIDAPAARFCLRDGRGRPARVACGCNTPTFAASIRGSRRDINHEKIERNALRGRERDISFQAIDGCLEAKERIL